MESMDISVAVHTPRERNLIARGLHLLATEMDRDGASDDELVEVIRLKTHVELDGRVIA